MINSPDTPTGEPTADELARRCRKAGPHGPTPCAPIPPDFDECACGCSGYEDVCPVYEAWGKHQHEIEALKRFKCTTQPGYRCNHVVCRPSE